MPEPISAPPAHKFHQIARSLRDLIARLEPGDRLPSVPELMANYHVSKSTVESAVQTLLLDGLIVRRRGSGTFVAPRRLRGGRRIGISTNAGSSPSSIFALMVSAVEAALRERELAAVLLIDADPNNRMGRIADGLKSADFSAYLNIGSLPDVAFPDGPGVVMGELPESAPAHQVTVDNFWGGAAAGSHLVSLGHVRFGFLAPRQLIPAGPRLRGYAASIAPDGNPDRVPDGMLHIEWFEWGDGVSSADARLTLETSLDRLFLGHRRPTALFVGNDVSVPFVLAYLQSKQIQVPRDVSVIGFDDVPIIAMYSRPALTTLRMPVESLAAQAVRLLAEFAVPGAEPQRVRIRPELMVRESTAPPPSSH